MKKITLDAQVFRRAQLCQSNDTTRIEINGVHLAANGDIVGTNRHVIYLHKDTNRSGITTGKGLVIALNTTIPKRAKVLVLEIQEEHPHNVTGYYLNRDDKRTVVYGALINSTFPKNYPWTIPDPRHEPLPVSEVSFSTYYLELVHKMFNGFVRFHFAGNTNIPAVVTPGDHYTKDTKELVALMLARID